jgi:hypothetical protein
MKNSIKLSIVALVLCSTVSNAQSWGWGDGEKIKGNGKVVSEKRSTAAYDEIKIAGFYDVDLVAGKEGEIGVQGEENLLPYLKIEVEGNVLKIYTEKGKNLQPSKNIKMIVNVPFETISKVSLAGSGDVNTKSTIKSDKFDLKLSGSGDMIIDLDTNDLETSLAGSGDIILKGKTVNLTSKVAGSGDINSYELVAQNADVAVAGSGDLKVFCTGNLNARVAGSGDIFYKGNPKTKDTKVAGSGDITAK